MRIEEKKVRDKKTFREKIISFLNNIHQHGFEPWLAKIKKVTGLTFEVILNLLKFHEKQHTSNFGRSTV